MPPERHADEHDQLGRGVVAIDVGARIGFRVAEALRIGKHDLHRLVRGGHPAEDVVARAVENARDRHQPVTRQAFANAVNQRHPAGDRSLEPQFHASRGGRLQQLRTVSREQHLVRRHHRRPALDCATSPTRAAGFTPPTTSTTMSGADARTCA